MKLFEESEWLMEALEIQLCVQLMGGENWRDVPVESGGRPLEQQMLDGFLHLVEQGLVKAAKGGYTATDLLEERFKPVAFPERQVVVQGGDRPDAFLYAKGNTCTCLMQEREGGRQYRVSRLFRREIFPLLEKRLFCGGGSELSMLKIGRGISGAKLYFFEKEEYPVLRSSDGEIFPWSEKTLAQIF